MKLKMYEKADIAVAKIPEFIKRYQGDLKFQAAETPYFLYERKNNKKSETNVLKLLSYLLGDMKLLLEKEE